MGHWLYHWVWMDFWTPVWPNIAAAIVCAAWTISRVKTHLHRHRAITAGVAYESRHWLVRFLKHKFGGSNGA